MAKNVTQKQFYGTLGNIGLVVTLLLLLGTYGAVVGKNFANDQVKSQLVKEKITFPPKGSPALDPKEFPGLQQYAGQAVDNGAKAKAFADEFIWVHMMKASGGKTYAEVSSAAQANPKDQQLATLKNVLFQGDMLRSSLLTAYAFSIFGVVAGYAVWGLLIATVVSLVLTLANYAKSRQE